MDTYTYDESYFNFQFLRSMGNSEFDIILQNKWNLKMNEGNVFWYTLTIPKEKNITEKFFLQLNINRAFIKRPPENICHINQPYNPDTFNFNKIKENEKLFIILNEKVKNESMYKNMVIVNVSPLGSYHILLVPNPQKCFPQVLTLENLNSIIEISLLSNSAYFRIGFNSLGAYASVNHLHFHAYYLNHEMFLETAPVKKIAGSCYSVENYPGKGFVFQIRNKEEIMFVVKKIFVLINLLQRYNIPQNLFITRGVKFETVDELSSDTKSWNRNCLRIYIWARKPSWGIKELSAFNIATCELFGHLVIKNELDFNSLTYDNIVKVLEDLTEEPYKTVMSDVIKLFNIEDT